MDQELKQAINSGMLVWYVFNKDLTIQDLFYAKDLFEVMDQLHRRLGIGQEEDLPVLEIRYIPFTDAPHPDHSLIPLAIYCEQHGIKEITARQAAQRGDIPGARKLGRNWAVPGKCSWQPAQRGWQKGMPRNSEN